MPVTLTVNGINYGGWETVSITRSIETLAGGFEVEVSERWPGQTVSRAINPGDICVLKIDNDTVITGYVDDVNASVDADSHALTISGRDKTADLYDCSAINTPGQWKGLKLEEITRQLVAPFGISLRTDVDTGEAFKKFNIQQGETVFECIQRMAKMRAVLVHSDGLGNIIITRAGTGLAAGALTEGPNGNIKSGTSKNSHAERYSIYKCKGQSQGDDNTPPNVFTRAQGAATDSAVQRYRPLLVIAEGKANTKQCQDRAAWERSVRSGQAFTMSVQVAGWRQANGSLWPINSIVRLNSASLKANEPMLICETTFKLDQNGSVTGLSLKRPDAFKLIPEPETI